MASTALAGRDSLSVVRDAIDAQRDFLLKLHAQWHVNDLFRRGVQNISDFDLYNGQVVLSQATSGPAMRSGYNMVRQTVNRTKSLLIQSPPRREARATKKDVLAKERSRLASIVMDDAWHRHKIAEKAQRVADAFIVTGNAVMSWYFDPTKGPVIGQDEQGQEVHAGELCVRFDNPDRWIWDPRASCDDDVKFAIRRTIQSIEWGREKYPDMWDEIDRLETTITDLDLLENRLLNVTQSQRYEEITHPRGQGAFVLFEYYEEPCPEYPNGRYAVLGGSTGTPTIILRDFTDNFYGCIPAVLFPQDVSSYRLLGDTFFNDLINPQCELNRRAYQTLANANMLGNPQLGIPTRAGTPPPGMTNAFGGEFYFNPDDGAPAYLAPPPMPEYVFKSQEMALNAFSMVAPASPNDVSQAEKTTSGIHANIIEEVKKQGRIPMVENWEAGWERFWKKHFKLWRTLTTHPEQVRSLGKDGQLSYEMVSGYDVGDDVEISIVPYSSQPTSRSAAFAEWSELLGIGFGRLDIPFDPMIQKRMLKDIGKGDMTDTWQNLELDDDLATRILERIITGQKVLPRVQDDPDVVMGKLLEFMKTAEYDVTVVENPMLEIWCANALAVFGAYKMEKMQAQMAQQLEQQMMMAGAGAPAPGGGGEKKGGGPANPVQAAASTFGPGAPRGGADQKMSQGFSKTANGGKDQGGRGPR